MYINFFFVLIWRTFSWSLSMYFRCTLYKCSCKQCYVTVICVYIYIYIYIRREGKPNRCHCMHFIALYDMLNLFRVPIIRSSRLYVCICRLWPRRQTHTYSLELLMMGIEVPETCWAYHKVHTVTSSWSFFSGHVQRCTDKHTSSVFYCLDGSVLP